MYWIKSKVQKYTRNNLLFYFAHRVVDSWGHPHSVDLNRIIILTHFFFLLDLPSIDESIKFYEKQQFAKCTHLIGFLHFMARLCPRFSAPIPHQCLYGTAAKMFSMVKESVESGEGRWCVAVTTWLLLPHSEQRTGCALTMGVGTGKINPEIDFKIFTVQIE